MSGKGFLEWVAGVDQDHEKHGRLGAGYSISPATVIDNLNVLSEGRVQVHIPTLPSLDPWARVTAMGGGSGRGFCWIPQVDDEVLVAFNQNDERDAYLLGGLWSMSKRPPINNPAQFLNKRVIKTGMKDIPGAQTIELDDLLKSVTITTSLGFSIKMEATQMELSAPQGAMTITIGLKPPSITIQAAPAGDITLSAPAGTISLQGATVNITGTTATNIKSPTMCSVQSPQVKLN
jgi:phage baseplate assembly protein gpV